MGGNIKGSYIYVAERQDKENNGKRIFVEIMAKIFLNVVKINKSTDSKNSTNLKQNK